MVKLTNLGHISASHVEHSSIFIVLDSDTIAHLVNIKSQSYLDRNEYTTKLRIFEQFKEKDDFLRWLYHYSITIYKQSKYLEQP